jgi:hypothetical protein
MPLRRLIPASVVFLLLALSTHPAAAQLRTGQNVAQVGVGAIPGVGLQGKFVQPRALYTIEGGLYADFSPSFAGGEGSFHLAGGLGGAIRTFGIARAVGSPGFLSDLDVGMRIGPALFFALGESSRAENPFSLFLEPFARFSTSLGENRIFFGEIGLQRPILRAGLFIPL